LEGPFGSFAGTTAACTTTDLGRAYFFFSFVFFLYREATLLAAAFLAAAMLEAAEATEVVPIVAPFAVGSGLLLSRWWGFMVASTSKALDATFWGQTNKQTKEEENEAMSSIFQTGHSCRYFKHTTGQTQHSE
jgi:hypothetical protein